MDGILSSPAQIESRLNRILPRVEKPARYVGGELNQVTKDWNTTPLRAAFAFPDVYDIINRQPDMLAERTYVPWPDMESTMRAAGIPLYSLETKHPIADFDVLGISLPYETLFTNTLTLFDLANIPLQTRERTMNHPLIIAGGHSTFNPEPMADFIDAFVIGEGEEIILDIVRCVQEAKREGTSRATLLSRLAKIWGVYVPSLYSCTYNDDGTPREMVRHDETAPLPIQKRIVAQLPPPLTRFLVPNLETVHNRAVVEIMRGCTRGCRFCQAGMITRPVRERPVAEVVEALEVALRSTGFEEVGLLSLSSSDYGKVVELVKAVRERFVGQRLNISLPSLRIESFSVDLMDQLQGASRRNGFTLAPEAAAERMREIINKPVATKQVLETAREIYKRGWNTIKLYFMIGHPSETLDDVQAIIDLAKAVLAEGRQALGPRAKIHLGVSTFVPKPHTPFQWVPCDLPERIKEKQRLLHRELRHPNIKLSTTDVRETMLEAWLSRGDRRLGQVILGAWKRGAKFDAWREHFKPEFWQDAFVEAGLDPDFYTHRERSTAEVLPWDHIDAAITKKFLVEDYEWSVLGKTRVDCRDKCFACGILPKFKEIRRQNPGDVWECPDVGKAKIKANLPPAQPPAPPAA